MTAIDQFSALLSRVYEAALDQTLWPDVLTHLIAEVGGSNAALVVASPATCGLDVVSVGADPTAVMAYNEYFGRIDPVASAMRRAQAGDLVTGSEVITRHSEFYNDWARPNQSGDGIFAAVLRDGPSACFLALAAPVGSKPFGTPERRQLVRQLVPHLQRAVRIQLSLGHLHAEKELTLEALETLPYGVMLATAGRVVHSNRVALEIAAAGDGLSIQSGCVRAAARTADDALQRLVNQSAEASLPSGGTVSVPRPSARRPYVVHVIPLSEGGLRHVVLRARQLIVVIDPDRSQQLSASVLRELFGFTSAEAVVALNTLNGRGLQAIADDLRVTLSTVRIHLQRVFEKTGTHRQAELVRLLLEIRPVLL